MLQQWTSTNIVNLHRGRNRERIFGRASLDQVGEDAEFGIFGEPVRGFCHFDGKCENSSYVHVGLSVAP